jgi:fermentation-respiration switch protein FrsA (DUF1100 family)
LDLLLSRKYEQLYNLFSPEMKQAITLEKFSEQSDQILSLGPPKQRGTAISRPIADSTLVTIPLKWDSVSLNFIVSWNRVGQIQGAFLRPAEPPKYERPGYSRPESFTTREVTIGEDSWKLPATFTIPTGKGPFPAVVLVHGSGPHDRDETVGGVRVFRDLAEGLSSDGIAVLRYEKRTRVYAGKLASAPDFTIHEETVEDAGRAAAFLRKQDNIGPVFVLGHSQGGYVAPRIAKLDPKLAGLIILAANARPLEELIVEQSEYLAALKGDLTDAQKKQLEALRRNPSAALASLPAKYREDLAAYNPTALAQTLDLPMLILQGERDFQVSMADFKLWRSALGSRDNVTFRSYPKLNHLFVAGEGKSSPAEYERPAHVAEEVIRDVGAWIRGSRVD